MLASPRALVSEYDSGHRFGLVTPGLNGTPPGPTGTARLRRERHARDGLAGLPAGLVPVINSRRRPARSGLSAPVTVEHRVISEPLVKVGQIKAQGDCGVEA